MPNRILNVGSAFGVHNERSIHLGSYGIAGARGRHLEYSHAGLLQSRFRSIGAFDSIRAFSRQRGKSKKEPHAHTMRHRGAWRSSLPNRVSTRKLGPRSRPVYSRNPPSRKLISVASSIRLSSPAFAQTGLLPNRFRSIESGSLHTPVPLQLRGAGRLEPKDLSKSAIRGQSTDARSQTEWPPKSGRMIRAITDCCFPARLRLSKHQASCRTVSKTRLLKRVDGD